MNAMRKLLIITYYWPPGSGAGVQRWLKFAKYLPAEGWEPVILTIDEAFAAYPAIDNSLQDEISDDLRVIRTKATDWFRIYRRDKSKIPSAGFASDGGKSIAGNIARFIRGNFFIPDPRRGWNRYALKAATKLILTEGINHVITTSPPHSTQLIGLKLRKRFPAIRWIADLRDPWTDIYYYSGFCHTPLARMLDKTYEINVLRKADSIITVGKSLKETFLKKLPGLDEKISVITNGYDMADFEGNAPALPGTFTISYIGTLSESYPLGGFISAVSTLAREGLEISLRFTGMVAAEQKRRLASLPDEIRVEFIPYVDHGKAIATMRSASMLLLVIPDHYSNRSIITGKLFEYLASGRPVLCLGPDDGDAAEILESSGHGKCAGYNDVEGITRIVKELYNTSTLISMEPPSEFSRIEHTKKLTTLL
jgi:glycosyltransferase involved in cell wall biosynthesis